MNDMLSVMGQVSQGTGEQGSGLPLLIGIMLFFAVFFLMTSRTQKKERAKKAEMLNNIKKNDRVMTIGGIIGSVVSVKDNEVVLKVDEGTNTRMTFTKKSIQQVGTGDEELKLD